MRTLKTKNPTLSKLLGAVVASLLALAVLAPGTVVAVPFSLTEFDGKMTSDPAGDPATQAGSHPYEVGAYMSFSKNEEGQPAQNPKDIEVELPAGMIGNAASAPRCTMDRLVTTSCPENTQVGVAEVTTLGLPFRLPLWNMVPSPGSPAMFGFYVLVDPVTVTASVRPAEAPGGDGLGGYGINLHLKNISQGLALEGAGLTFWGNPSDQSHDVDRGDCLFATMGMKPMPAEPCTFQGSPKPFLTSPTTCNGQPLVTRVHVTSWANEKDSAEYAAHDGDGTPFALEGCEELPFGGSLSTALETSATDSPSGLAVDLRVPQNANPTGLATANLKRAEVKLPPGVSVNPSAATGLTACSVAQFDQFGAGPSSCPANSKIGTLELDTPLLDEPMDGAIYLARQNENPFGSMLAIYLVAEGSGVRLKLPGKVSPDPVTGQLTTTFDDNPQLPFEELSLRFFDGPRAVLATPVTCGTQATTSSLGPWSSGLLVNPASSLTVGSGPNGSPCPANAASRPFGLALEAGTQSNAAGGFSPFVYKVGRPDGAQEISRIEATLPKGVLAKLAGVPECAEAAAAAGTCGAASQVGTVEVGVGAGTNPFHVRNGRAYLTGPYAGAPLGLDFVVPAVAGPLDLGLVNVRAGVFVDPTTAQVTVKSDPLPRILQGIPLRIRSVQLGVDRDGFMVNPTSCDPSAVGSRVTSTEGAGAELSDRFQAAGCGALAFKPKLRPKLLGGRKALQRRSHPALQVTVTEPKGQANIAGASLALPRSILLDQGHIRTVCTRVQFAARQCPQAAVYGSATVTTPLLDQPLSGPVYLRSSNNELPDLVADLRGQLNIVLAGRIDSHKGGIRTTFTGIPDAPISKFVLKMKGGAKGLLQNSVSLCRTRNNRAKVTLTGQNGKVHRTQPTLATGCPPAKR